MRAMAPMAEMSLAMGLTTRIKETLALSTGVQALDAAGGGGSLSFDLPDFAGRGRLLTLVWTDQGRIGVGSQTLLIRDPVVADLFLPRFLAPGDEVDVRLLVSNTQDRAVTAELSLQLETGLDMIAGSNKLSLDLDAKGQQPVPLRLRDRRHRRDQSHHRSDHRRADHPPRIPDRSPPGCPAYAGPGQLPARPR